MPVRRIDEADMRMARRVIYKVSVLSAALWLGLSGQALAHDPGLSSADVVVDGRGLTVISSFARQDIEALVQLDTDLDASISEQELNDGKARIASVIAEGLRIRLDDQAEAPMQPSGISFDDKNNVQVRLRLEGTPRHELGVRAAMFRRLPKGHRQFVSVKDATGRVLGEKMLNASDDSFNFALATSPLSAAGEQPSSSNFLDFLKLGVEHILSGYDHLLFLLALLLVTRDVFSSFKIITYFTLAHSITLALASFDLVEISSTVVEPLIAATIVYVGIENLVRGDAPKGRWLLTFVFGLVHGFGFAGVLRELGVTSGGTAIAVPLFSFNLGVELGQLTVASFILPFIWRLSGDPLFITRWVPACSALISVAGGYWLIERTLLG